MRFSIVENTHRFCDIIFKVSRGSQRPYRAKSKKTIIIIIYILFVLLDPCLGSYAWIIYTLSGQQNRGSGGLQSTVRKLFPKISRKTVWLMLCNLQ